MLDPGGLPVAAECLLIEGGLGGRWPDGQISSRAARYWALTAGAFFRAATHWAPFSSGVVLAALTAPPAAMARATAAIVTSSGASIRAVMSYLPYE